MHKIITDVSHVPEGYKRLKDFPRCQSTLSEAARDGRIRAVKLVKRFGQKGGPVWIHQGDAEIFFKDRHFKDHHHSHGLKGHKKSPAFKPPWVKVTGYADIMDVLQEINGKLDRILRTQKPLFRAVK